MNIKSLLQDKRKLGIIIFSVCALSVVLIQLVFSQYISNNFAKELREQRETGMKRLVKLAYTTISPTLNELRNKEITKEDAKIKIANQVRQMKYDDEYGPNYIFMSGFDGTMLVQPYEPQLEGSNQWNLKDAKGNYIIRKLIRAAQSKPEGSFVSYYYYPPNKSETEEKISYVLAIPEIDAYIGTGMYMESTYKSLENLITYQRAGFITINCLVLFLIFLILKELINRNQLLSSSEEKYRALYQSANDAIVILDNNVVVDCNNSAREIYGYTREQLIGKHPTDFSPEFQLDGIKSQDKAKDVIKKARNGEPQYFEWMHERANGEVFYAEVGLSSITINNKQLIQAIVRDITEKVEYREKIISQYEELQLTQKQLLEKHQELTAIYEELSASEEELRKNYEELNELEIETSQLAARYMLVCEAAKDVIWDYDLKTGEFYVSGRIYELLGYADNDNQVKINDIYEIMHPEDRDMVKQKYIEHLKGETLYFACEHRIRTKNGSYKWFYSRGKVSRDSEDKPIRYAGSLTDITEKKLYEKEIKKLAFYDYLTGLPNRVAIIQKLQEILPQCPNNKNCFGAVFFIDIDNFKIINDTFGHSKGDMLLKSVAQRLRNSISDKRISIARIGGDEFVILFNHPSNKVEIENTAKKVIEIFNKPFKETDNTFNLTCSIGISMYPQDGLSEEELFKTADLAMYKAKNMGKNKFLFYNTSIGEAFTRKIEMEDSLREAVRLREFYLVYQPQIDMQSGSVVGFEALIRWNSKKYGLVSPIEFIPLAEETGMILEIGDWVFSNAFSFAAKVAKQTGVCPNISINVSPVQFIQNDFVDRLLELLNKYQLNAGSIGLEITENILVNSFEVIINNIIKLRELGFKIYIDDFGRGYSSLNYLKNLPIDVIKIDKSFIDNILNNEKEQKILDAIIVLANNIGLLVVAEGVETQEQYNYLKQIKCHIAQGYLISKPITSDEVIDMLLKC